jgi:Flp pilus assembly protein TadD
MNPLMNRPKTAARRTLALAAVALACAGALAGCSGHGKYTREHIAQAKEKMTMLKSGTEYQMAQQQFLAGDLDKAMKTIDRSVALNPNVARSHVLRGRILLERGRLEQAREALLTAESLDDQNVEAQYYLGIIHERVNEPVEALARYSRAAELDPANPQYLVAAAEMHLVQGHLDEAERMLTEKKSQFRYNAAVRQALGQIAMLRGDASIAAKHFADALTLASDDAGIMEDLIRAQMACGDFAEAEYHIQRLLEREENKNRRDLMHLRARCLMAVNRPVEARTLLLELTGHREGSRDLRAWIDLGNVAASLKDRANLRTASQRVLAIAPDRHEGWMLRALLGRIENNPEQALAAADQAAARTTTDAAPFLLRALILEDLGRLDEARESLVEGLHRDPNNRAAQTLLAALDNTPAPTGAVVGHGAAGE